MFTRTYDAKFCSDLILDMIHLLCSVLNSLDLEEYIWNISSSLFLSHMCPCYLNRTQDQRGRSPHLGGMTFSDARWRTLVVDTTCSLLSTSCVVREKQTETTVHRPLDTPSAQPKSRTQTATQAGRDIGRPADGRAKWRGHLGRPFGAFWENETFSDPAVMFFGIYPKE